MSKPLRSFNRLPNGQFAPKSAYAYVKTYDSGHKRYYLAGERVRKRAFEKVKIAYVDPSIIDRKAIRRMESAILNYEEKGAKGEGHVKDVGTFTYDEKLSIEEAKLMIGSELNIDPKKVYTTNVEFVDGEWHFDVIADFSEHYQSGKGKG